MAHSEHNSNSQLEKKTEHNPKLMEIMDNAAQYFRKNYLEKLKKYIENSKVENSSTQEEYMGTIHIYSHLDADGLSAASILALAFRREGMGYQITILKQLEEQYFPEIQNNVQKKNQFVIFADFGSGQLNLLDKNIPKSKYIILDHHEILKGKKEKDDKAINFSGFHANPYLAGVNGSSEISGSGMAYLFALALNPENKGLSYIAIIGAIGDMQNSGPQQSFLGENNAILQDALQEHLIEIEIVPSMTRSKSLSFALAYTLPIKIKKFQEDIRAAGEFIIKNVGIKLKTDLGEYRTLADLTSNEKKKLTSELVQVSLEQDSLELDSLDTLIGTNYLLQPFANYKEIYNSKDFSKLLNACGRLNKQSIGLAIFIQKNEGVIKKAIDTSKEYSEILNGNIKWLYEEEHIKQRKSIQYFYGENKIHENIIGVLCSSLSFSSSSKIEKNKPIIGYTDSDEGFYKISARCRNELIEKGVNLSSAIRDTCKKLGIEERGGGHPPAAGAKVPRDKIKDFLKSLDEKITQQIKKKKGNSGHGEYGI
ncbi:MAG: DHHA1 domain-containing protein [Promethearchaeota archaeon]